MEFPEGRGVYPGSRFWKIQRGGGVIRKIPSVRGVWIFSGTTQYKANIFTIHANLYYKVGAAVQSL